MTPNDAAYMAGLFDGEGHVEYKKRLVKQKKGKNKAYRTWTIRCEMSREAKKSWTGKKPQWRWRCGYRDAFQFAKLLWPYAQVKLHPLEQIIDHYEPEFSDDNVVSLEDYK